MTLKQKGIVASWIGFVSILILLEFSEKWLQENWDAIKWPSLITIAIIVTLSKSREGAGAQGWRHPHNVINDHPWIKLYMAVYCLLVVGIALRNILVGTNNNDVSFVGLTLAVLGIVLPVVVIQQIRYYKDAGRKG